MIRRSFGGYGRRRTTARVARVLTGTGSLIAGGFLLTACGSDSGLADDPALGLTTTIDTVDGTVRVTNSGTPPEWRLTRVASIGPKSLSDTGSPEEFGRVWDVALGPDGTVFVVDGMNHEVRVFGIDGVHRRTFGQEGEGPGEFAELSSVTWLVDRLLALDPRQGRISEFSAEGEYLGHRRIPAGAGGGPGWPRFWRVGADEAYHITNPAASIPGRGWEFVGVDSRGDTGATLLPLGGVRLFLMECAHRGVRYDVVIPFAPRLVQIPGSGGVMYSALTSSYRIAVIGESDDTVRVIERSLLPEPVSDEEWADRTRAVPVVPRQPAVHGL